MSSAPYGLAPAVRPPAASGAPAHLPKFACAQVGAVFPHGYSRPSVPRAAFSRSASVGRRLPAHEQKAAAFVQVTSCTGTSSVGSPGIAVQLPAATQSL
jgi:hypothetical protein